jgi:L-asparaginase
MSSKKRILIIQTGGTIAMDIQGDEHTLDPDVWKTLIEEEIPELRQLADIDLTQAFLEDSSDVNHTHWQQLIQLISEAYDDYDGFVVLHGTDTMAYTASALSYGLQQLQKPIILTGSQVPMKSIRSDARRNLVNAIEMATYRMNEVAICFNDHIFRGNRSTKMSIGDFDAFASPNHPPLAEIGLNVRLNYEWETTDEPLQTYTDFDDKFFTLKVFPDLNAQWLEPLPVEQMNGVIIEAFGSGNVPTKGSASLLPFIERCRDAQTLVVVTSQAPYDAVDLDKYENGRIVREAGAISAFDMTHEATVTKLMHLFGQGLSFDEVKQQMLQPIAGELTC